MGSVVKIIRPARRFSKAFGCHRDGARAALPARAVQAQAASSDMSYDYDLLTIGGGSGGVRASRFAGGFGAKAAIVELPFGYIASEEYGGLGGTCVLRGCVPKKLLMYCSEYSKYIRDAEGYGYKPMKTEVSLKKFMEAKRKELQRLNNAYSNTLGNASVEKLVGRGKLVDPHTVDIGGKKYTAKYICIAVGGLPNLIKIPGIEHCISSDQVLELEEVPKRLGIVGAGYIAVEFGGMFNNLGSKVSFFVRGDGLLRGFDNEIRGHLKQEYERTGISVNLGCQPKEITKNKDGSLRMKYSKGEKEEGTEDFDQILVATGRKPNSEGLGLEDVGVETDGKGHIRVDEYSKTNIDSIYAIGDVTNRIALTPVALMEGGALAKTLFNNQPTKPDHKFVATAVFSQPHIGTCGYTEEEAVEEFGDVDVYTSTFKPMKSGFIGSDQRALYKVVVDHKTDKVIGMHLIGPDSGEIMQGFGVAIKAGVTKTQIDSTVGIHPTSAEEIVTMREVKRQYRGKKLVKGEKP